MAKRINMVQNHYDEVKRMPPGFICLAQNKLCPYQIIRHPSKPAYGVQAHSEYYFNSRPDGGPAPQKFPLHRGESQQIRSGRGADRTSPCRRKRIETETLVADGMVEPGACARLDMQSPETLLRFSPTRRYMDCEAVRLVSPCVITVTKSCPPFNE